MPVNQGLRRNSRGPGSIANSEHYDPSGASKSANGSPATMNAVIADSTVLTPLEAFEVLRVVNNSASPAFIWHGRIDQAPGSLTIATAMCLPANSVEIFFCGSTDNDMLSMAVQASATTVQIVRMKL